MLNATLIGLAAVSLNNSPYISSNARVSILGCSLTKMFSPFLYNIRNTNLKYTSFSHFIAPAILVDRAVKELVGLYEGQVKITESIQIYRCEFRNSASTKIGGIYVDTASGDLSIEQSFFNNIRSESGAIYFKGANLIIDTICAIKCNSDTNVLLNSFATTSTLKQVLSTECFTRAASPSTYLFAAESNVLTAQYFNVSGFQSLQNDALLFSFNLGADSSFSHSLITNNFATTAIEFSGNEKITFTVDQCKFVQNTVLKYCFMWATSSTTINIKDSIIASPNNANFDLFSFNGQFNLNNCKLSASEDTRPNINAIGCSWNQVFDKVDFSGIQVIEKDCPNFVSYVPHVSQAPIPGGDDQGSGGNDGNGTKSKSTIIIIAVVVAAIIIIAIIITVFVVLRRKRNNDEEGTSQELGKNLNNDDNPVL